MTHGTSSLRARSADLQVSGLEQLSGVVFDEGSIIPPHRPHRPFGPGKNVEALSKKSVQRN